MEKRKPGMSYLSHWFEFGKDVCSHCGREWKQVVTEDFICRGSTKFKVVSRLMGEE